MIKHSIVKIKQTKFIIIPLLIYSLFIKNKNYLSIFSKEYIEEFLLNCFPHANELETEKGKKNMRKMFDLKIINPN